MNVTHTPDRKYSACLHNNKMFSDYYIPTDRIYCVCIIYFFVLSFVILLISLMIQTVSFLLYQAFECAKETFEFH